MFRKIISLILCISLCFCFAACGSKEPPAEEGGEQAGEAIINIPLGVNNLTGLSDISPEKTNLRPVAISIDNDSVAQKYAQAGLQTADIVYETEVEGGITRLLAVFKDVSKAPQIGDIRSAREQFVQLALGHGAIFVHHGVDPNYCSPFMKELGVDNFVVGSNCGWRETHKGATNWQNLYTTGEKLSKSLTDNKWKTISDSTSPWQTFVNESITLSGGAANKVTVAFSGVSTSYFTYNAATGTYIKTSKHTENKDTVTGASYNFKNVFVLQANMSHYPIQKYRKIDFSGGNGYYVVNGTYEQIKWTKGGPNDSIVLTKADGTPLNVQAGNSWVCFVKTDGPVSFE